MGNKKVLYIDPISSDGHLNFNRIYLTKLLELNVEISLVFRENYFNGFSLPEKLLKLSIPNSFYKKDCNGFINRWYMLNILLFIKRNVDFHEFDIVIFASYEEISLFFSRISNNLILINHNNLSGLNVGIKRFFFKRISNRNTHIVFEQHMKDRLLSLGIKKVMVIPHGLPASFSSNPLNEKTDMFFYMEDLDLSQYKYIIYSPSGSSVNINLLKQLLENKNLLTFLKNKQILLIVKSNLYCSKSKNIVIFSNYLSEVQYRDLFLKSDAILITYPKSHKFRVSAIFFECMANKKLCLLSDIDSFRYYDSFLRFDPYFNNSDELIQCIINFQKLDPEVIKNPYINTERLIPSFKELL